MKADQDKVIELKGVVTQSLSNGLFRVKLENGFEIIAHISGKIRRYSIKVLPGDSVAVQLSIYDLTKGRIVYRFKAPTGKYNSYVKPK